jgi:hypothetical protein
VCHFVTLEIFSHLLNLKLRQRNPISSNKIASLGGKTVIHPTLRCPKHGFAYVSMPRMPRDVSMPRDGEALDVDDLDALDEEDSWLWKCPLVICLHGVRRRPVSTIIREHDIREHDNPDKDGNPNPSPTGESL